jgi:hypothetical protein
MANYRFFGQSLVDAATGLAMEAVSQMVDGLDAFGSSKDCAHWFKDTMRKLTDAAAGKSVDGNSINGGLNVNPAYNSCLNDIVAGGAPALSSSLEYLADKARDGCQCATTAASAKRH